MKQKLLGLAVGTTLAVTAMAGNAQTGSAGGPPASVGVSQGTAAEAASKAVPRNDTGTLVRTAPSATDKAKAASSNSASGSGSTQADKASQTNSAFSDAPVVRRTRKADRN